MSVGIVWVIFCPIAGAMAYLITYEEYRRHFPDARRARREAWLSALFTLGVFAALGAVATFLMPRVVR